MEVIAKPFGWLMLWLYNLVGNYGVAVILFALVVKLIMLPFQLKSTKSMMRMSRMTPRLKELEKKFGNDQQRYQQEMNKLYKEEGVNPMSGCLWTLLPFPILIALYRAIRFPLTTMMGVDSSLLGESGAITLKLQELGYQLANYSTTRNASVYEQIFQSQFITEHFASFAGISDKLQQLYYNFLGLNLGDTPQFAFWAWDQVDWNHIGLFLIPLVSAALSYLSMKVSNATNPQAQAAAANQSNKTMMLMMPVMSVWICYTMPGVLGIYWIAQSVFATVQTVILNKIFGRQLDEEDADRIAREKAREAELEAKREETERLKAEGRTVENVNTSKKNKKAAAAQKEAERKAAEARAERARKRAARGETEDIPESQVGNRRYARGRAYVADRYTNPDEAQEKTLAAAQANEEFDAQNVESGESAELTEISALTEEAEAVAAESVQGDESNWGDESEEDDAFADELDEDEPEDDEETERTASDDEE